MRIMVCEHCLRKDCPGDEYDVLWPDGNVSQTCCSDKNIDVENRTLKVFISNTDPMYVPVRPSPGWGSDGKRD